jgi:hypothetical protein
VIELTDEMVQALWRKLPSEVQEGREPDDVESWVEVVLAAVERNQDAQPRTARKGYETAIAVLRDVADRTGSPAAGWCADYLLADPDRLAPPPQ